METKDNSTNQKKLLSHHWDLNYDGYQDQISFNWKNNKIRIEIHSICNPPGRDKCIKFEFFINGEYTLFKFLYNCYGCGIRGKTPELKNEDYRLTFKASSHFFEVYEETIKQDDNQKIPLDKFHDQRKDTWIPVFNNYRSGTRYDTPFADYQILLWIKKVFNYQYSSDILLFKYEVFSNILSILSHKVGNFTCHKIFDHCKPIGCGVYSSIGCEISDVKGCHRTYYWGREGSEEQPICDIIKFFLSLRCYNDWKDYDQFQELCKSYGVSDSEIEKSLTTEISDLGILKDLS
ncbi:MAG: hypothetical protein ABSD71_02310 [Bacteroidales bacterium]|jgi:hypothetical protein